VKDWQVDPVKGSLLHVDIVRVAMDVRVKVRVPVHTFGEAQGVKLQGGIFEMVTREVEIECLPSEIPGEFKVDITDFMIGRQLRAGDLTLDPEKMKLVTDPQRVIAHVVALRSAGVVQPHRRFPPAKRHLAHRDAQRDVWTVRGDARGALVVHLSGVRISGGEVDHDPLVRNGRTTVTVCERETAGLPRSLRRSKPGPPSPRLWWVHRSATCGAKVNQVPRVFLNLLTEIPLAAS